MNSSACAEVYQIIQYLPEEEYRLIPKEKIDYIKKNMDKNFKKICTFNTNIDDINLSDEARDILLSLFYNNVANEKQKKQLEAFLMKKEQENLKQFDEREFFASKNASMENKDNTTYIESSTESKIDVDNFETEDSSKKQLIAINENSWNYKIKKFFNKILEKLRIKKK